MTLNAQQIFLSNDPYYTYTDTLEQTAFNFTFRFSLRERCWYMDIYTVDNIPVILATKLVPQYPILQDFRLPEISGYFWLYPTVNINLHKIETDPEYIADYFTLLYFYET